MATKAELLDTQATLESEKKEQQARRSKLVLDQANPQLIAFVDKQIEDIDTQLQEVRDELGLIGSISRADKRTVENRNNAKDKLKTLREQRKTLEESGGNTRRVDADIAQEESKLAYYTRQLKESPTYQEQQQKKKNVEEKKAETTSNLQDTPPAQATLQNATYQQSDTGLANVLDRNGRPIKTDVYVIGADIPKGMPATRELPWSSNIRVQTEQDVNASLNGLSREERAQIQTLLKKYGAWDRPADGSLAYKSEFDAKMRELYLQMTQVNLARLNAEQKELPYTLEKFLDAEYTLGEGEDTGPRTVTAKGFFSLSDGESKLLLDEYYRNTLGRAATQDELKQFQSVVKKRAERKPSVTKKTYQDGALIEERTLEPGFGQAEAQLTAFRQAKARPEFAAYQLANTYYDAILAAAQSPINIQRPTS
jgi:hypothetical protein